MSPCGSARLRTGLRRWSRYWHSPRPCPRPRAGHDHANCRANAAEVFRIEPRRARDVRAGHDLLAADRRVPGHHGDQPRHDRHRAPAWSARPARLSGGGTRFWQVAQCAAVGREHRSGQLAAGIDSLEAAWKYVIISSLGVTIALAGTLFLFYAGSALHLTSDQRLTWPYLFTHAAA